VAQRLPLSNAIDVLYQANHNPLTIEPWPINLRNNNSFFGPMIRYGWPTISVMPGPLTTIRISWNKLPMPIDEFTAFTIGRKVENRGLPGDH